MWRLRSSAAVLQLAALVAVLLVPAVVGDIICDGVTSETTAANASRVCVCKDGWTGPSCNICMDNGACRSVPNALKSSVCYQKSYTPIKDMAGICDVNSDDVGRLIHGHGMINMRLTANGSFSFDFIKVNDQYKWIPLFKCTSNKTTVESDPARGQIRYVSPDLACNLSCVIGSDRTCTAFLNNVVGQVGNKGGSIVTCEPKAATCDISESVLNTFLGGVNTNNCRMGECAEDGKAGSAAVVDFTVITRMSTHQKASIALGSVYVCLVGLLFAVALSFWLSSRAFGSHAKAKAFLAGSAHCLSNGGDEGEEGEPHTYSVVWQDLTYQIGPKRILKGLTGLATPGQLLAIMGPSGSGKTSLLDILARKTKMGTVGGRLSYNGVSGESEEVRERIGFVDQEDNLLGTMTVFESVLLSAVLRLPDNMPLAAKAARVMRVLKDLRLSHVADSYVGSKTKRGISGGEKRRVMVAMELVKVPSVLLLDEPTSGLDAFNANLLVTCLKDLAARKATNVIMTIHQPRSNIFTSFDRLLVINQGEVTYHGSIEDVAGFFHSIGRPIPAVYNPADYLIDVLFEKEIAALEGTASPSSLKLLCSPAVQSTAIDVAASPVLPPKGTSQDQHHHDDETKDEPMGVELTATKPSSLPPLAGSPARQAVERAELGATKGKSDDDMTMGMSTSNGSGGANSNGEPANPLALKFKESDVARAVQQEVLDTLRKYEEGEEEDARNGGVDVSTGSVSSTVQQQPSHPLTQGATSSSSSSVSTARATTGSRGAATLATATLARAPARRRRAAAAASWASSVAHRCRRFYVEVGMLSKRTILGLIRNPLLLASHTIAAGYFAVVLGIVYYQLAMSSLGAIQNRLGAFLLSCVFLTFTSVSALPLFWLERSLYIHEHSNRFYSPAAYFITKVFFDLLLLRCVPSLLFGGITYGMIGFRPGMAHFVAYQALLVLLITTSSMLNLIIGMVTKDIMSGILIATIVMIHFLMLTNLFINFGSMRLTWLRWLKSVSFINYAYEGLAQNELVGRRLENFPISTGTGVLAELGFRTDAFYEDLLSLLVYLSVALVLAYLTLRFFVKERR